MKPWGMIYGEPQWCCSSGNLCNGGGWEVAENDVWSGLLLYCILTGGFGRE